MIFLLLIKQRQNVTRKLNNEFINITPPLLEKRFLQGGGGEPIKGSRSLNQSPDSDIRDDSNRRVMYLSLIHI